MINKTDHALTGNLVLNGIAVPSTAQIHRYSAANLAAIVHDADQKIGAPGLDAVFPASSITLLVIK